VRPGFGCRGQSQITVSFPPNNIRSKRFPKPSVLPPCQDTVSILRAYGAGHVRHCRLLGQNRC
jgi:hypothetical protein